MINNREIAELIAEWAFSILCRDLDLWALHLKMYTARYKSLSRNQPDLGEIGWKTAEKSWNASRTDFLRLSLSDLDLCPMTLQMHWDTVLANVYTPATFHQDRMKNDREIATSC